MSEDLEIYLKPTDIIDSDHPDVVGYARKTAPDPSDTAVDRAVQLYYGVRDPIWYDPYLPFYKGEHYRASRTLKIGRAFCIGKATLLCALGRASGIPARLGFADVRNHLATKQLLEYLGNDLFSFHGFVEFYLEGKWVKATPAFNLELCRRHSVIPLEFDGKSDSIFHPYNQEQKMFMEYVADHGTFADVPVDRIVAGWQNAYGHERVRRWISEFEQPDRRHRRKFDQEEVAK
jgi:transglutaminase-like putative cysteine protease